MSRPLLFFDLAGTLEVRDPVTGRWGAWPGVAASLADLAVDHDLHLTTGDGTDEAAGTLEEYGLGRHFRRVHGDLRGAGKPFGALAAALGRAPAHCLAVGDNPFSDTASDTDEVVSVLLEHSRTLVEPTRVVALVRELGVSGSFLAGFLAAADRAGASEDPVARLQDLAPTRLGGGGRLGWWLKEPRARRPVVVLAA
ncbi:MAG TPA: hypothetical protein PLL30_14105 [Candidatus Krumholzibacteria bacterium]|nr:hypothetical protein [Candidatus Krumholzibacteria bacterium]HPD72899.1 hypothetical protein [Candidatus Krumholzibacteria bacterium]HRY41698.1 hypothetical protein [Candidatus Krumholzibacteria bacterium]